MAALAGYSSISISFEVHRVLEVASRDDGTPGFMLSERTMDEPYTKDYDAFESPLDWPRRFDVSNWARAHAERANHLCSRRARSRLYASSHDTAGSAPDSAAATRS